MAPSKRKTKSKTKAELEPHFRFADLPPELRNNVYQCLLTFEQEGPCHPQILSTCSWIHGEAADIIYAANPTVYITLETIYNTIYTGAARTFIDIHGLRLDGAEINQEYAKLPEGYLAWPKALLKFRNIHLRLVFQDVKSTRGYRSSHTSHALCSFACFLLSGPKPLTTRITIEADLEDVSIMNHGHNVWNDAYHIARLCANFPCIFDEASFTAWDTLPDKLERLAAEETEMIRTNVLEALVKLGPESIAFAEYADERDVTEESERDRQQWLELRQFVEETPPLYNPRVERWLYNGMKQLAPLFDRAYAERLLEEEGGGMELRTIKRAAQRFKKAHKKRQAVFAPKSEE